MSILGKTLVLGLLIAAVRRIAGVVEKATRLPTEDEIDAALQKEAEHRNLINMNVKESLVDVLKIADIRSDFTSRAALWVDLGHDGDAYKGTAEQNTLMLAEVRHLWIMGDI